MTKNFAPNVFAHVKTEMVWLELMELPGERLRFFQEFPDGYFILYHQKTGMRRAIYFRVGSRNRGALQYNLVDKKLVMKLLMAELKEQLQNREGWPEAFLDLEPSSDDDGWEQLEKEVANVLWPAEGKERRAGDTSIRSSNARVGDDHPGRYVATVNLRLPRGLRFTTQVLEPSYGHSITRGEVTLWGYKQFFTLSHPTIKPQLLMTQETIAEELQKAMVDHFSFMAAEGAIKDWNFDAFHVANRA